MTTMPTVSERIAESIAEIQQSRSRYQLEHFVIGQFDTPEMQFLQICIELQDMEYKLATATIALQQSDEKIKRLRAKGTVKHSLKADMLDLEQKQTRLLMIGAEREVAILRELFVASPKYTRAEIEQSQPEYWRLRLSRQYQLQEVTRSVGWAQLDAMIQAGIMEQSPRGVQVATPEPAQQLASPA